MLEGESLQNPAEHHLPLEAFPHRLPLQFILTSIYICLVTYRSVHRVKVHLFTLLFDFKILECRSHVLLILAHFRPSKWSEVRDDKWMLIELSCTLIVLMIIGLPGNIFIYTFNFHSCKIAVDFLYFELFSETVILFNCYTWSFRLKLPSSGLFHLQTGSYVVEGGVKSFILWNKATTCILVRIEDAQSHEDVNLGNGLRKNFLVSLYTCIFPL